MSRPQPAVPFADPPWLNGLPSPYYDESHRSLQRTARAFIDQALTRNALEWETNEEVPPHVFTEFAKANFIIAALPAPLPVEWLRKVGITHMPGDIPIEKWDSLHNLIFIDEMNRAGLAGPSGAITVGIAFGVPPIITYGSQQLKEKFLPDLLLGRKRACIAITEPEAGSDVANITTTAVPSNCGRYYIVNGSKKWITNGMMADVATVAVRTGEAKDGAKGLSLLLMTLKDTPGVSRRRLKVAGQVSAGTTFIEFDNVRVPKEDLIGKEGEGMKYIMNNFNHERMTAAIGVTRQARVALSSAFAYCLKREAFGKPLMDQPVVRHRLAKCAALLESQSAWLESFAYQESKMSKSDIDRELGGLTALVKAHAGIVLNECAQCAVLLFGGNGFTRTGQGEIAEKIYREVPGARIPGGSEDVMLDLAIRQMVKLFNAKLKEVKEPSRL